MALVFLIFVNFQITITILAFLVLFTFIYFLFLTPPNYPALFPNQKFWNPEILIEFYFLDLFKSNVF